MPFNEITRFKAAARTGGICANPRCSCYILGPADDGPDQVDVFDGAHIISEQPGGPRFEMIPRAMYNHISNCIPLCKTCHWEVDHSQNWRMFPATTLRDWKLQAEDMARLRRNKPVNVPFYDPDKERATKNKFDIKLAEITQALSDERTNVQRGVLPKSAFFNICNGASGFSGTLWRYDHPNRSHDSRIAYSQDAIVETMLRLRKLFYEQNKNWGCYSWLQCIDLYTFRLEEQIATQTQANDDYNDRLQNELQIFITQCKNFICLSY